MLQKLTHENVSVISGLKTLTAICKSSSRGLGITLSCGGIEILKTTLPDLDAFSDSKFRGDGQVGEDVLCMMSFLQYANQTMRLLFNLLDATTCQAWLSHHFPRFYLCTSPNTGKVVGTFKHGNIRKELPYALPRDRALLQRLLWQFLMKDDRP